MTMHDDSDVQLLERDLRRLAAPRQGDDQLHRELRGQLLARPQPERRRRLAMRVAFGSVAVAGAAIVALIGLAGSRGPASADAAIIRHAITAITPPANEILHMKLVGVQNGVQVGGESWQQTSAPYASRFEKGPVGHVGEFSDDGMKSYEYDARTNTLREQPDVSRPTFTNPISQIRQELVSGKAQLVGTVAFRSSTLYKIDLPNGLVGYFDQSDYRPRYLDDPQRDGTVVRLSVAAYQYLPMTQSNRALLSLIVQHPGARIVAGANQTSK